MKLPSNSPQTRRILTLSGLFVSATVYALLLCTRPGKRWAAEQTWATVVAGVSLTLAWLALEDRGAAKKGVLYFAASGAPIVVRSLWLQLQQLEHIYSREMK